MFNGSSAIGKKTEGKGFTSARGTSYLHLDDYRSRQIKTLNIVIETLPTYKHILRIFPCSLLIFTLLADFSMSINLQIIAFFHYTFTYDFTFYPLRFLCDNLQIFYSKNTMCTYTVLNLQIITIILSKLFVSWNRSRRNRISSNS